MGPLLKVACAACGCLLPGGVLAPNKEWWATSAGSGGSAESVEPQSSGALTLMPPYASWAFPGRSFA